MSLILEALRKLEREKPAPERGVVVMTSAGLGEARSHRGPWLWVMLGLAAGVAAAALFLEWRRPPRSATAHVPAVAAAPPTTAPTPPMSVARSVPVALPSSSTPRAPASREPRSPPPKLPVPVATPQPLPTPAPAPAMEPAAPPTTLAAPMPAPALVLQAITVLDGRPVVLINDRVLREGDEIHGVRIHRIGEAEVEIERDGQREVLRF